MFGGGLFILGTHGTGYCVFKISTGGRLCRTLKVFLCLQQCRHCLSPVVIPLTAGLPKDE